MNVYRRTGAEAGPAAAATKQAPKAKTYAIENKALCPHRGPERGNYQNMAYSLSRYEQETIIRFDEEGPEAKFYTASPVWMRKMDKLTAENPADFREIRAEKCQGEICAKTYTIPKDFITIRSKRRILSEEQRAANAERLRKAREMKSEA